MSVQAGQLLETAFSWKRSPKKILWCINWKSFVWWWLPFGFSVRTRTSVYILTVENQGIFCFRPDWCSSQFPCTESGQERDWNSLASGLAPIPIIALTDWWPSHERRFTYKSISLWSLAVFFSDDYCFNDIVKLHKILLHGLIFRVIRNSSDEQFGELCIIIFCHLESLNSTIYMVKDKNLSFKKNYKVLLTIAKATMVSTARNYF